MKIEDEARESVASELVNWIALKDGSNFNVVPGSFGVHSPAVRGGDRGSSAFVRFRILGEASWVEAPLGSLVAYGYPTD